MVKLAAIRSGAAPHGRHARLQLAGLAEQRHRQRQQRPAVLVEQQAAADAIEERLADRRFERRQRRAGGRLRARDAVGGGAGRAGARGGREDLELAQR